MHLRYVFIGALILTFATVLVQFVTLLMPLWHHLPISDLAIPYSAVEISLWQSCLIPRYASLQSPDCFQLRDFNKRFINIQKSAVLRNKAPNIQDHCLSDKSCPNDTLHNATCDPLTAPHIAGASMSTGFMYNSNYVHYRCVSGYQLADRYSADSFCRCNETACSWTTAPSCLPLDPCLANGIDSDICIVGNLDFLLLEARETSEPQVADVVEAVELPKRVYLFPDLIIPCSGVIRQWDIVAARPGIIHIDVWHQDDDGSLMLVGSNRVLITQAGLGGYYMEIQQRIFNFQKGDMVGVHFDDYSSDSNSSLLFGREINKTNTMRTFQLKSVMDFGNNVKFSDFELSEYAHLQPVIIGYITSSVIAPINVPLWQGCPLVSFFSCLAGCLLILFVFITTTRFLNDKTGVAGDLTGTIKFWNRWFDQSCRMLDISMICFLFAAVITLNGFLLAFGDLSTKNCNVARPGTLIGSAAWIWLGTGVFAIFIPAYICWLEMRLAKNFPINYRISPAPGHQDSSRPIAERRKKTMAVQQISRRLSRPLELDNNL